MEDDELNNYMEKIFMMSCSLKLNEKNALEEDCEKYKQKQYDTWSYCNYERD